MERMVQARPAVLRALGMDDPPAQVEIDNESLTLVEIFKHDSWAATALYRGERFDVVCKFNRIEPIGNLSLRWLGRQLARREAFAYQKLAGITGIISSSGPVSVNGQVQDHAVAHRFMPGHPLRSRERVSDEFFPELLRILQEVHQRGFAYVDLHKRENVLVGVDRKPYLIDFQISFFAVGSGLFSRWFRKPVLSLLQKSDLYHLAKHVARHRPDQLESLGLATLLQRPWWIEAHRAIAVPFRQTRRKLLTLLRVRGKSGRSSTEVFAEHAFRCEKKATVS